jgi:hypothetical protein
VKPQAKPLSRNTVSPELDPESLWARKPPELAVSDDAASLPAPDTPRCTPVWFADDSAVSTLLTAPELLFHTGMDAAVNSAGSADVQPSISLDSFDDVTMNALSADNGDFEAYLDQLDTSTSTNGFGTMGAYGTSTGAFEVDRGSLNTPMGSCTDRNARSANEAAISVYPFKNAVLLDSPLLWSSQYAFDGNSASLPTMDGPLWNSSIWVGWDSGDSLEII